MRLNEFFVGVAAKRLRPVEVDARVSNQHEFNGINQIRTILGTERRILETVFLYVDDANEPVRSHGTTTWYDSRIDDPSRSAEYRLYFPSTAVSDRYSVDDLLVVALRADGSLLIIAAPSESIVGDQLLWLFGLDHPNGRYLVRDAAQIDREVDYVVRWVLESIGIEAPVGESDPELIVRRFGHEMPTTRVFSEFAREQMTDCNPVEDPDHALMVWLETEERFFRAFERLLVEEQLRIGFVQNDVVDVDGFIGFSLSVQNRRKSRAGYAFENHLEFIFRAWCLRFDRGATTEARSKPDFLFPGKADYLNAGFAASGLSVLGAKATCKDRWRQILGEADRVTVKHLATLEPSISTNQTDEMKSRDVQLVLPNAVQSSYSESQRLWLWSIRRFIEYVQSQQN